MTRADLEKHYDAVEGILAPTPVPFDVPGYPSMPKTIAMRDAAQRMGGADWTLPPLGIAFSAAPGRPPELGAQISEPEYKNLHGAVRRTCRLCRECRPGVAPGSSMTTT